MARPDRRFAYLLSVASRRVQSWTRREKGEITGPQAGALFVVGKKDGALVGDVARALGMGLPGASGLVDRMVEAGLVERRADDHDGRSWRLFLTRRGSELRIVALAAAADINARLVAGFTESELDIVSRWLAHVGRTFSKGNEP